MKLPYIFSFLLLLCSLTLHAQTRSCATHTLHLEKAQQNPAYAKQQQLFEQKIQEYIQHKQQQRTSGTQSADTTFVIPVVVHVIHNISNGAITGNNISDAQIYSQITILNEDFGRLNADASNTPSVFAPYAADCKIQFCLASSDPNGNPSTGITRTYNSKSTWGLGDEYTLKALSYWPSDQYLNIWVCSLSGGILGYAQMPGGYGLAGLDPTDQYAESDGVVINQRAFGNTGTASAPYNLGRTATHEVGHWLGMRHIWGDVDANTGDYCGDDYVNDTPWQQTAHTDLHTCDSYSQCQQSGGSFHLNMTCNYMDYSTDDCMNMFTADQRDRMHAVMHLSPRRMALFNSRGCCMSGLTTIAPLQENFNIQDACFDNGWTQLNGDEHETLTEKWENVILSNGNGVIRIINTGIFDTLTGGADIYYDYLTTPNVLLNKAHAPVLTFDLAYASNGGLNTDSLVVSYAANCDTVYTKLITLYGTDLISTSRTTSNFVPGEQEWKNVQVNLSPLQGKAVARFRFEDYSKQVNAIYLDNVNLFSNANEYYVVLYPIPANGILNADIYFEGKRDLHWLVYNELGQKVIDYSETQVYSHTKHIDISNMAAGIYYVKIISGDDSIVEKIMVY